MFPPNPSEIKKLHIPWRLWRVWVCPSCKDLEEPGNTAGQSPRDGLKLCHLNVRCSCGQRNLSLVNQVTDHEDKKYHIKGYHQFRANRRRRDDKERGGGVALFVKYNLQPSEVSIHPSVGEKCDAVFVKVSVEWSTEVGTSEKTGTCDVILGAIYCPPDLKELETVEILTAIAEKSIEKSPNVVLTGDFNVNLNVNSPPVTQLKNSLQERGFTRLVENPTRTQVTYEGRMGTLIDHIWTTLGTKFAPPIVHATLNFTDHDLISATFGRQ